MTNADFEALYMIPVRFGTPIGGIFCLWFTHGSCVNPSYDPANAFDHACGAADTKLRGFLIIVSFRALRVVIGDQYVIDSELNI